MGEKTNSLRRRWIQWLLSGLLATCICGSACRSTAVQTQSSASAQNQAAQKTTAAGEARTTGIKVKTNIGFRTKRKLDEHYDKHGREFGSITKEEYLRLAQELRDASAGGDILEASRDDGTTSRFDRRSGAFLAFEHDLTIRTFFKPNDGEAYFRRQLKRPH
jgi:pyocin large subunit-like protein